jgi:hypothetical protein
MDIQGVLRAAAAEPCVAVQEMALREHKYQIGQTVYFTSRPVGQMAANDSYRVVKLLPYDGEDNQYRIKSTSEAFERVAKESQLDRSRL